MIRNTKYNIVLGKGCGLIEETLSLLSICDENTTKDSLAQYVHDHNSLAKCSDLRSMDIVKLVFFPRFMKNNPKVVCWLRAIRERGLLLSQFKQLLMIYCARENAIMYDFILSRLNQLRENNVQRLERAVVDEYVDGIVEQGLATWSDSIKKRQGNYIKSVLVDFDMLTKRGDILPYEIGNFTVLYLMHELHFAGLSDMAIWNHEDWQLFGLDKYAVQQRILEQNLKGGYIAQCSGELLTISWNHKSMEDFINAAI
jgi:hypothetical protein